MNSINNKKVLRFEQIVAGAILVFEQLDFLDMELLMQKIESAVQNSHFFFCKHSIFLFSKSKDFMLNRRIKTLQETKRSLVVDFRAYYQNNPSYFVTVENYRGFENPFMSTKF